MGIFTFHSHPQTGGICPVLDSDALSSQAPTDVYHPGREDDKLFLGRICMSSSSPSGSALWGQRQSEHRRRPVVPLELTSRCCLGQTAGSEAFSWSRWRTEDLAVDGAVRKTYLCMANGLCAFSHGCFRRIQLPAMMLTCQFALMSCARPALCGVLNTLHLSLLTSSW